MGVMTLLGAGAAASAAIVPTTLNPADLGPGLTISGGNLTITGGGGFSSCRSVASATSGKYYVEAARSAVAGASPALCLGVCTANASMSGFLLALPDAVGVQDSDTTITEDGSSPGHITSTWTTNGAGIDLALDVGNRKIWMRNRGGNWNNDILANQNPATNTGGVALSTTDLSTMALFVFASATQTSTDKITVNFGATAFVDTPPTGFGVLH